MKTVYTIQGSSHQTANVVDDESSEKVYVELNGGESAVYLDVDQLTELYAAIGKVITRRKPASSWFAGSTITQGGTIRGGLGT